MSELFSTRWDDETINQQLLTSRSIDLVAVLEVCNALNVNPSIPEIKRSSEYQKIDLSAQLDHLSAALPSELKNILKQIDTETVFRYSADRLLISYTFIAFKIGAAHSNRSAFCSREESFHSQPEWKLSFNMPNSHLTGSTMALWGFFRKHPHYEDNTVCFMCGYTQSDWKYSDVAYKIHYQFRPFCPWVLFVTTVERCIYYERMNFTPKLKQEVESYLSGKDRMHIIYRPEMMSAHLSDAYLRAYFKRMGDFSTFYGWDYKTLCDKNAVSLANCIHFLRLPKRKLLFTLWRKVLLYWMNDRTQGMTLPNNVDILTVKRLFPTTASLHEELRNYTDSETYVIQLYRDKFVDHLHLYISEVLETPSTGFTPYTAEIQSVAGPSTIYDEGDMLATQSDEFERHHQMIHALLTERKCVVCRRRVSDYLILPCQHLCMCEKCVGDPLSITQCPACKKLVTDVIKIYTS